VPKPTALHKHAEPIEIMIAISTSYFIVDKLSAADIIMRLAALDISEVELSYNIDEDTSFDLREALNRSQMQVCSVHNFFPIPPSVAKGKGGGDIFLLSNPAEEERCKAVEWTKRSIEQAGAVDAKALVLHCGRVEMSPELEQLYAYFRNGQIHTLQAQDFIRLKLDERENQKSRYLDSILRSLEDLIPVAEHHNIILSLENRYHYHELPGPDEFEIIFKKFAGAPIGYWHDTGHAHAQQALGIFPAEELLKSNHQHLVGMHLHDAFGLDDHLPPGAGEIDFKRIRAWMGDNTLKVIELKPGTPDSDAAAGIHYLKQILDP
jgi:sugar phosphate isomerase/epimerase